MKLYRLPGHDGAICWQLGDGVDTGQGRELEHDIALAVPAENDGGGPVYDRGAIFNERRLGYILHLADDLAAPTTDAMHAGDSLLTTQSKKHAHQTDVHASGLKMPLG